jgi:hypothetical protein
MHLPSPDFRLPETGTMSGSAAATAPALVGRPRERQPVDGQLVYTFSEAITLAPGASLSLTVEGQPPVAIALAGNPAVSLSGSTITIRRRNGQFSESNENRVAVAELIANGVRYQPCGG